MIWPKFFLLAFIQCDVFEVKSSISIKYVNDEDSADYFDGVYDELALISCNDFSKCKIEYTHVITNKTGSVDMTEDEEEGDNNDGDTEIDSIGTDGFVVITGRFPTIVPDCCANKIVRWYDDTLLNTETGNICPGVHQLQEDQRTLMDLKWPKMKPADVVLKPFMPEDDFNFEQTFKNEYFHMHKSSHLLIKGVNYFIGGEKYYSLYDTTDYTKKEFNTGVWKLEYNQLTKTSIPNQNKISRAASAVTSDGIGYICGSLFNPKECFLFDGEQLTKDEKILNHGHTDESAMIFTKAFGLLILGGGENVYYLNNKGDVNPEPHSRHGIVETRSTSNEWKIQDSMNLNRPIVGTALVELGTNIWLFGGSDNDSVYVLRTTAASPKWSLHSKLLSPRSGHVAVVNYQDNTVMLVGGSLKSMNKPIEMWTFTSSWSTSKSSIKKLDSRTASNNPDSTLNAYYTPTVIPKKDYPRLTQTKSTNETTVQLLKPNVEPECPQPLTCAREILANVGKAPHKFQNFEQLLQDCQKKNPDSSSEALICAYCGLENEDFKDFVFAFCQSGLDPTVLCSDKKESLKDVLEEVENTIETQVSWATVIESEPEDKDSNQVQDEIAEKLEDNFKNADEIIPEEVSSIPKETFDEIKEITKDEIIEEIEVIEETPVVEPPTNGLRVNEILLISVGSIVEAAFLSATVYFIFTGKRTIGIFLISLIVLIPIISVVGYYWMIEEISDELGIGLITSSTILVLIFGAIILVSTKRRKSKSHVRSETPMSEVGALSRQTNPYQID